MALDSVALWHSNTWSHWHLAVWQCGGHPQALPAATTTIPTTSTATTTNRYSNDGYYYTDDHDDRTHHNKTNDDDDYTDDCQDALRLNVAYIKRILKAGGRKPGAYETYERDQRHALANIVRRHVVGHRVPAEIGDIIVEFWGHPGGYVVF